MDQWEVKVMPRHGKIETLANAATILLALLVSAVLVKAFLLPASRGFNHFAICSIGKGMSLKDELPRVDWGGNGRTLILAVDPDCRYSHSSVPFYQRLSEARGKRVKLLALVPGTPSSARRYIEEEGIPADTVMPVRLRSIGVVRTPTLILVDGAGTVREVWEGALPSNEEQEVIADLQDDAPLWSPQRLAPTGEGAGSIMVDIYPQDRIDAVRIVQIMDGDKEVMPGRYGLPYIPGKRFRVGGNWLGELSFTLKNRTSKTIAFVGISLFFPKDETDFLGDRASWQLDLGQIPKSMFETFNHPGERIPQGTGKPLQFRGGQEMTISLADQVGAIRARIEEKMSFGSVTKCVFGPEVAYFDEGIRWGNLGNGYDVLSAQHPVIWLAMPDFPGELNPVSHVN